MMKKAIFSLLILLCCFAGRGQSFLVDRTDSDYLVNEKNLSTGDKTCYTVNCISKDDSLFETTGGLTPLVFIKIFTLSSKKQLSQKPSHVLSLKDYISKIAVPGLKADLYLSAVDMRSVSNSPNVNVYDSLILFDGKSYCLLEGVVEVSFYNLLDFDQLHIQQSNPTIINTKAKVAPLVKNGKNGLMVVDIDKTEQQGIFQKLYLTKKQNDLFSFTLISIDRTEDDVLDYEREFVYKKGYGIVEFKGKWLFYHKSDLPKEPRGLFASPEYYYFK